MSVDKRPYSVEATKDGQIIIGILKNLGIISYEKKVIHRLLDFIYGYTTRILEDAKLYSDHANKKMIDIDDVKLSITMLSEKSFTDRPSREMLIDLAQETNSNPLPRMRSQHGLALPPPPYSLISPNYKLRRRTLVHQPPPFIPFHFPISNFSENTLSRKYRKKKNQETYNELVRQAQLNLAFQNQIRLNLQPQYHLTNPGPRCDIQQPQHEPNIYEQLKRRFACENNQ